MFLYSAILFAVAVLFFFLGRSIYRGNTNLIHDYHQTRVEDKAAYGKAFGKAMFTMAAAMALSGLLALFVQGFLPVLVLFLGLIAGIIQIILVHKKYNNGVF